LRRIRRRLTGWRRDTASLVRVAAGRGSWRGLFVIASGAELGAIPDDVVVAMRHAVAKGRHAEILVLDYDGAVASLEPPDGVKLRRFWADPAPAKNVAPDVSHASAATPVRLADGTLAPGYYRDGLPVAAVLDSVSGSRAALYSHNGLHVRNVEYDHRGSVVRVVDVDPTSGAEVAHRYLDEQGSCWLSVTVLADGTLGHAYRSRPKAKKYADLVAAQADWVRRRVAITPRATIISAGSASHRVASLVGK
jgi:hypothetical protein